jgi:hypothetical protein
MSMGSWYKNFNKNYSAACSSHSNILNDTHAAHLTALHNPMWELLFLSALNFLSFASKKKQRKRKALHNSHRFHSPAVLSCCRPPAQWMSRQPAAAAAALMSAGSQYHLLLQGLHVASQCHAGCSHLTLQLALNL